MRVVRTGLFPVRLPRRSPLVLAYATRTAARGILLKLETDDGRVGWGEAAPVQEVTGERPVDVLQALERVCAERLLGVDPVDREPVRRHLRRDLASLPAARCAAETALCDLRAQAFGVSLRRLLGGARDAVPACVTLGLDDEAGTVAAARARVAAGFTVLKLKVGRDPAGDAARVLAVRRAVGTGAVLLLDANQGFTVDQALAFVTTIRNAGAALLEQPVPAADLDGLAHVSRASPVPICADEAVTGPESLAAFLARRPAPFVNVKLQKCGGPVEAEAMVRQAEAAGVGVLVGCMVESGIGIAAGLAVALGCANVAHADLDGALDLAVDTVAAGGARLEGGRQFLDDRPGLGVEVDEPVLAAHRDEDPGGA